MSVSSIEALLEQRCEVEHRLSGSKVTSEEWLSGKLDQHLEARLGLIQNHIEQMDIALEELNKARDDDSIHIDMYTQAREEIDSTSGQARRQLIGIKLNYASIKGNILDRMVRMGEHVDNAYMKKLALTYASRTYFNNSATGTIHAQLSPGKDTPKRLQQRFEHVVTRYYAALDPKSAGCENKWYWCPFAKSYQDSSFIRKAHIVPQAVREANAIYLFGHPEAEGGHLSHPSNGLLMHWYFKDAMDKGEFAIIPLDETAPTASRLKIVVFNKAFVERCPPGYLGLQWDKVDGMELQFRNRNRPSVQYLYLHFLMCIIRRRRYGGPGWRTDLHKLAAASMWPSPGKWIRYSALRALARRICRCDDLEQCFGTMDLAMFQGDEERRDEELVADEVWQAYDERARAHDIALEHSEDDDDVEDAEEDEPGTEDEED